MEKGLGLKAGELASLTGIAVEEIARVLDAIHSSLNNGERDAFGLELLDAARKDRASFAEVIASWQVTVQIRKHPDFERQTKEFQNLVQSGELMSSLPSPAHEVATT